MFLCEKKKKKGKNNRFYINQPQVHSQVQFQSEIMRSNTNSNMAVQSMQLKWLQQSNELDSEDNFNGKESHLSKKKKKKKKNEIKKTSWEI